MRESFSLGIKARPGYESEPEFETQHNYFLIVGLGLDLKPQLSICRNGCNNAFLT